MEEERNAFNPMCQTCPYMYGSFGSKAYGSKYFKSKPWGSRSYQ